MDLTEYILAMMLGTLSMRIGANREITLKQHFKPHEKIGISKVGAWEG